MCDCKAWCVEQHIAWFICLQDEWFIGVVGLPSVSEVFQPGVAGPSEGITCRSAQLSLLVDRTVFCIVWAPLAPALFHPFGSHRMFDPPG
jgi:hypothetical protein